MERKRMQACSEGISLHCSPRGQGTHDNGDQAHGKCAPEHTAHEVVDGRGEEAFEADITDHMAHRK